MSVLRSLPVGVSYVSVHSSLVIGVLFRIFGLKEFGLGTQSLGLEWPLSEVGTRLEQQICSGPHRLIIWACLPGLETKNKQQHSTDMKFFLQSFFVALNDVCSKFPLILNFFGNGWLFYYFCIKTPEIEQENTFANSHLLRSKKWDHKSITLNTFI